MVLGRLPPGTLSRRLAAGASRKSELRLLSELALTRSSGFAGLFSGVGRASGTLLLRSGSAPAPPLRGRKASSASSSLPRPSAAAACFQVVSPPKGEGVVRAPLACVSRFAALGWRSGSAFVRACPGRFGSSARPFIEVGVSGCRSPRRLALRRQRLAAETRSASPSLPCPCSSPTGLFLEGGGVRVPLAQRPRAASRRAGLARPWPRATCLERSDARCGTAEYPRNPWRALRPAGQLF